MDKFSTRQKLSSLTVNVGVVERLRARRVVGWGELLLAAGLSGKIATKVRAGLPVSPRSVRKLAQALGVPPARIVELPGRDSPLRGAGPSPPDAEQVAATTAA